jgi:uncharacterized protein YjiS (DUF1127 family)
MKEVDMTYFTDANVAGSKPFSRTAALFGAIALKMRKHRAYRQTFNELSTMTSRDLADLGMCRSDFRRISREAADIVS